MTSQLERDLYCLTSAGYLIVQDFCTGPTLERICVAALEFEQEVQDFVDRGGEADLRHSWPLRTTRCLYAISEDVQRFAIDPRLLAIATGYLGAVVLRDCLLQTNMPDPRNAARGARADVSYHRDTLWPDQAVAPMYLHAFLLLSDCSARNGATIVVPGSHRSREPGYYFKDTDPRGPQPGIDYQVYDRRYFASAVPLEAPRGSLIVLDPMLIHTQGTNVSHEPRSLLNATFRAAGVKGMPPLLNARAIAERFARVSVDPQLVGLLEADPALPAHFGPLR